ncbi:4'-phosphopantetheinyl transferase superfamily protein [Shimia thalassica]|uniref:4'-phosphopantetheinyl transferase family protein n=1 Tax=Shimia thalassica TaxID=1715693 RepID=UPI0026E3F80E|nr:4'-phosphopantetheinyl transferase superfamily protein [Shimia thalassica]MDO6522964.1 4'-phosphopantetheinyl transferase superfamily protein [Shimia thalassica]
MSGDIKAALIAGLPQDIGAGVTRVSSRNEALFPQEMTFVKNAVPSRLQEFSAGRAAARGAMKQLGLSPKPILAGADRAPVWPDGVIGSISHHDKTCVAVVSVDNKWRALGIDIEPDAPLAPDLVCEVCTTEEQNWLAQQPEGQRLRLARMIFCAKECTYKCQYPLSQTLFGFDAIEISLKANSFEATFLQPVPLFETGQTLNGEFTFAGQHMIAFMAIPSQKAKTQAISTEPPYLRQEGRASQTHESWKAIQQ